jgi:Rrf2 family protein
VFATASYSSHAVSPGFFGNRKAALDEAAAVFYKGRSGLYIRFQKLCCFFAAMISQTVEYALRAIVTMAQHHGQPQTAKQISAITQVPAPYLSKFMQGLVRAGLVGSQRGLHGGFVLVKDPKDLTIWEVVDAVDPIQRIRQCPLGIKSHGAGLCPLHRRLDQALALVEEQFRCTTIAELLAEPGATPLCDAAKKVFVLNTNLATGKSPKAPSNGKTPAKN